MRITTGSLSSVEETVRAWMRWLLYAYGECHPLSLLNVLSVVFFSYL